MFDWRRPVGRLLFGLLSVGMMIGGSPAATPTMTTVADTVYRADGAPAAGTLLISWPAFSTASGIPVGAGTKSVSLGAQGALSVSLVPNVGATPAGTYYTVVFQLDDSVRSEYWIVGTTSPTTIAAVRTILGSGNVAQLVSRQYVDTAISAKANDAAVVHNTGTESVTGTKQFSAPPSVPTPLAASDAVNKAYVDTAVAAVGSGSYVQKNGDSMTGPLTLSGEPGRMKLAEDRLVALERNDIKRNVYDRIVTATIAFLVSAAVAMHDHWWIR
jgi:trimeric autotransporter adhesin